MNFIINSIVSVPLYHGTSTLFLDSIKQHGLGAIDPIRENRVLETTSELYQFAIANKVQNHDSLLVLMGHINRIINQVSTSNSNFQHGQVYVTTEGYKAKSYACDRRFGSEAISLTILLIELLRELGLDPVVNNPFLLETMKNNYRPIIIELNNVSVKNLLTEQDGGQEIDATFLEDIKRDYQNHPSFAHREFRLIKPIDASDFIVHFADDL